MRHALTLLAFSASFLVIGIVAFFAVIVLAGPHAGMLPQPLEVAVIILGWIAVLVCPTLTARAVWRRFGKGRVA